VFAIILSALFCVALRDNFDGDFLVINLQFGVSISFCSAIWAVSISDMSGKYSAAKTELAVW
jgi:hypothetical protein